MNRDLMLAIAGVYVANTYTALPTTVRTWENNHHRRLGSCAEALTTYYHPSLIHTRYKILLIVDTATAYGHRVRGTCMYTARGIPARVHWIVALCIRYCFYCIYYCTFCIALFWYFPAVRCNGSYLTILR